MKFYIINIITYDNNGEDSIFESTNAKVLPQLFKTKDDAMNARKELMEIDIDDFKGIWDESDGYIFDTSILLADKSVDTYIDVLYDNYIVNETIYKIEEVELYESK